MICLMIWHAYDAHICLRIQANVQSRRADNHKLLTATSEAERALRHPSTPCTARHMLLTTWATIVDSDFELLAETDAAALANQLAREDGVPLGRTECLQQLQPVLLHLLDSIPSFLQKLHAKTVRAARRLEGRGTNSSSTGLAMALDRRFKRMLTRVSQALEISVRACLKVSLCSVLHTSPPHFTKSSVISPHLPMTIHGP